MFTVSVVQTLHTFDSLDDAVAHAQKVVEAIQGQRSNASVRVVDAEIGNIEFAIIVPNTIHFTEED